MRKVWKRPHPRNCKRLRSARPVSVSISQNWTRTFICRRFCKASSGLEAGWLRGLDGLVVNREATLSEQLREPMGNSGEGQGKKVAALANLPGRTLLRRRGSGFRTWVRFPSPAPSSSSLKLKLDPRRIVWLEISRCGIGPASRVWTAKWAHCILGRFFEALFIGRCESYVGFRSARTCPFNPAGGAHTCGGLSK